jgi:NAD(P)-dependent dehydrogenase (short-subunit alcohol dehydrogenase family)
MEFTNKVVLITGASSGIGAATAILFAKQGATVIINYLKSESLATDVLEEVKKYSDGMIIQCDVTNEKQVQHMIESIIQIYSKINILVNNVGGYIEGDEWDGEATTWQKSLTLNVLPTLIVSKYVAKEFIQSNTGVIVNIASRFAHSGDAETITYAASKAAILSITQAYSKLLSPFGRANSVSPGATDAGYWKTAPKEEVEALGSKKLISPEVIAEAIVTLCSEQSAMINGQDILVNN